jgi:hypothetical protein
MRYPYIHSTLKLIHKQRKIIGTLHVPGQNGDPVDMWTSVGRKWRAKDVQKVFIPWKKVNFKYTEVINGTP